MSELVKIPAERVRILIGESSKTKKLLEEKCKITLDVEGEGDVEIEGDATEVFFAKDVIKAIGRGFAPHDALRIIEQDFHLYLIPLKEIVESENAISRLKGRVIGENGKVKNEIEAATESVVSVYGNTIGILSKIDTMEYAKEAISMLLDGAPVRVVLNYLAKAKREIFESRLKG